MKKEKMATLKYLVWLFKLGFKNLKLKALSCFSKEKRDPYRLLIKIDDSCNYRCSTCGSWKKNNGFISEDIEEEIISKFKNRLFFLSITGGEPFLKERRLINFVEKIKKRNPNLRYLSINTNCSRSEAVKRFTEAIFQNFSDLRLYLGLHYIPNESWGESKTGVKNAHRNYEKTVTVIKNLQKKYKKRLHFYKTITLSKTEDIEALKEENDLWLNLAVIDEFYNNLKNDYITDFTEKEKGMMIDKFLKLNKKNISFLNKRYLTDLKKIVEKKRRRKCFAGLNRVYIDNRGNEFICSRLLENRKNMSIKKCASCWTPCEANFDLLPYFFLPPIFDSHHKKIK